jgi:hypothetical protein
VSATSVCTKQQYAQYGKCQTCPSGKVPKEDRTGCI